MARRIAIIGGAGFIGSHLANRCLDRGDEVHVVVRPTSDLTRLDGVIDRVTLHRLLLSDRAALDRCFGEAAPEQLFHLGVETRRGSAPGDPDEDQRNLATLLAAAVALKEPPRSFVRAGSCAEYGDVAAPYRETGPTRPVTPYGAAMLAATRMLDTLRPDLPFPAITARPALVYGSGQSRNFLIPALIHACLSGDPLRIERPGDRRDLVHVSDAVEALMLLAESPPPGVGVINIASGIAPTMREVAALVIDAVGSDPALVSFNPDPVQGGTPDLRASPDLAREAIGWWPRIPLAEGIRHMVTFERASEKTEA